MPIRKKGENGDKIAKEHFSNIHFLREFIKTFSRKSETEVIFHW